MARYPKMNDPGGKNVIPSVTEIIGDCTDKSGALTQWAANMTVEWIKEHCLEIYVDAYQVSVDQLNDARFNFKTVSQKALDIGSEVHGLIENYLTYTLTHGDGWTWPDNMGVEVENAFRAFWNWSIDNDLKPISLEQTVYGDGWAGTLDFYGYFDGKLYVIDWKSSKAHYPEMRYQVAAYRWAIYNKTYEVKDLPKGCGVLRLDKETGLPHWKDTSKSYEQDLRIFNRMVDLYFERHPIIRKRARG